MPDPLYDAIARAIEEPLDGNLFERCAVDLLRERYYPTLMPVDGGGDAGMDGKGELPNGERFFLVSTVGEDSLGNLDRNVQSHLKAGGDRRVVVFATTRKVTGQTQLKLSRHLQEQFGVRLHEVHDRGDFIDLLYRNPRWRRDLLGVAGVARALTRLPATRRPTPEIPFVGRDDDLRHLRDIAGNLVLVGKPGIGKTYLLQKLMEVDWGLFDAGWDVPQLEDAIRELQPRRVVVDDAHLNEGRIAELRRLRREMDVAFDIVAVSWPGQVEQVAAALPGSSRYEVRELDRDQILEVVKAVGIAGPRELQALIVGQALGRAGLAVTLAYACISGSVRDVATGDALLTDVVGWFSTTLGDDARYVLGILALTGDGGATLQQVARALNLNTPRVSELIRGLASGGTIDEVPWSGQVSRLRVQPESLRYALVRDVFYGGAAALDVTEVVGHLDHPSNALLPLIGTVHRGARVDRRFLRELLDLSHWADAVDYAGLGASETDEALERAPRLQFAIARASYERDLSPERCLRVLMELAVGDGREEHNTTDHPLRVVSDRLHRPDENLGARLLAVSVADQWLRESGDQEVALRVLMHAIYPGAKEAYADPGLGNTVTVREAALPTTMINELSQTWDLILDLVERESLTTLGPVLHALHPWVYPGQLGFGRGPDKATRTAIRDVATRVISRLACILNDRPGALHKLREYASRAKLAVTIEIPPEFDALFPADWGGADEDEGLEEWERRAEDALRTLAVGLAQLPEVEIAARIAVAEAAAADAGISYPRLTPQLAALLASQVSKPDLLLDALEQRRVAGDILLPVLDRVAEARLSGWDTSIERLLSVEMYTWLAMRVALVRPVGAQLKDAAIQRMTEAHSKMIDVIVVRGEADLDTTVRLLNAPDRLVARATAVALAIRKDGAHLSSLPEAAQRRWRDVIVQNPADDHWYSKIFGRDPELFADWLKAWFGRRQQDPTNHELVPRSLRDTIGRLPIDLRIELIRCVPSDVHAILVQDVVTCLVSSDLEVMAALFERTDLDDLHWVALRDGPSETWMDRALIALERGWIPARIVAATAFQGSGWMGEQSAHWQSKIAAFAILRRDGEASFSQRECIIAAGIEHFEKLRDRATEGERRERIFGR